MPTSERVVSHEPHFETGVQVTTKTFPIAFLMLLFKTKISIDGVMHVASWGTNFYPLEPGHHSIQIGFRYFFGRNMGRNSIDVDVLAGQVVQVDYHAPNQVFAAGSISIG